MTLKLSDYEFWSLTWSEFQALSDARGDEDEKMDRRFGRLMALQFNQNRGRGQVPKGEEDFIPKRKKRNEVKSKEELTNQIESVFNVFMQ